jgi:putative tryptophan/tyrosine transport system substrate-binding protein
MRRRDFLTLLGAATIASPRAAFAQSDRKPRVGVLMGLAAEDKEAKDREKAVRDGLRRLGWIDGQNIQIDVRMAGGTERIHAVALELIKLGPNVLVAAATTTLSILQKATTTIPIVFAQVTDPVGAGFVKSLARPGGNITGFTQHEFSIGVKWLELLKELAPRVERVAILYDPRNPATTGYLSTIRGAAPAFRVQVSDHTVRDTVDIERAVAALVAKPNGGLLVLPGPSPSVRRDVIIGLAQRHRLPAVYPFRYWVTHGGLAFYGVDNIELYRLAATYVDKILKGDKPADLPVQHATKFELVLNLKAARALGLDPPLALLARTDEVIE